MKITYDPKHNIAYIAMRDDSSPSQVQTLSLSDDVKVDLAPDGTLYGIELLNANAQLASDGSLAVINAVTGEHASVRVAG